MSDEDIITIIGIVVFLFVILFVITLFRKSRYHKNQQKVHTDISNNYGDPQKSLYISTKVFTLHQATDITDENDNVVYHSQTKFFTLHDSTQITNSTGAVVANIRRKFFTIHERRFITMSDGTEFQLSNELFHIIKDITNVEGLGWKLEGNILGLNFTIKDSEGHLIAYIGQKVLSVHDKYSIDIYDVSQEAKIVAIVVGLQHMMRERSQAATSASSASAASAASSSSSSNSN